MKIEKYINIFYKPIAYFKKIRWHFKAVYKFLKMIGGEVNNVQ